MSVFATGRAQTVLTEDFESPDTPNYTTYTAGQFMVTATNTWAITLNSVDLYEAVARPEAAAFDGAQAVDLTGSPGAGVMETSFTTVPGTEYELVFHYARNAYIDPDTADAQVEVIGAALLLQDTVHHNPAAYTFDSYLLYQGTFTADSTETTLRFTALDNNVAGVTIDGISVSVVTPVGTGSPEMRRDAIEIVSAHPNPFNPNVAIDYLIPRRGIAEVSVYDITGRFVRTLVRGEQDAGFHSVTWTGVDRNGSGVASGVYFAVLTTRYGSTSRRLALLK